jgi:hypothetical protein
MFRKYLSGAVVAGVLTAVGLVAQPMASASTAPSGERTVGQSIVAPAYDDSTGGVVYFSIPTQATVDPNPHNTAPLYFPVYPVSAPFGPLDCRHIPGPDNCPDHGPAVAGLAAHVMPGVYGGGVLGHDHLIGIASTGGDFNVDWLPVAVLFTNKAAANQHLTTKSQLDTAVANHNAIEIPIPSATFHGQVVSAAVYEHGTPVA